MAALVLMAIGSAMYIVVIVFEAMMRFRGKQSLMEWSKCAMHAKAVLSVEQEMVVVVI